MVKAVGKWSSIHRLVTALCHMAAAFLGDCHKTQFAIPWSYHEHQNFAFGACREFLHGHPLVRDKTVGEAAIHPACW